MLFKERSKPKLLTAFGALLNRLPNNHARFEEVSAEYRKRAAGFGGEQFFDKHIHEFRPSYPYALLHDICLRANGIYFQIDSLLITPSAITVFEVKNLAGKIMVKPSPTQFIQVSQGESKVIQSPITELDRKEILLKQWLRKKEIDLPRYEESLCFLLRMKFQLMVCQHDRSFAHKKYRFFYIRHRWDRRS